MPWGFPKLDNFTHGIQQAEMTTLIARAGVGKSAWAGEVIVSVAGWLRRHGIKKVVRLVSLEMTFDSWMKRWACRMAGVEQEKINTGYVSEEELEKYNLHLEKLGKLPIECLDVVDSLETITNFIKHNSDVPEAKISNCAFWVVDHIGIVPGKQVGDRFGSLADASTVFRQLSRDVAPSLILSQMNRNCESRDNKRPNLGDVYGSDRMVQDSRKVFGLYREDMYLNLSKELREGDMDAELIILKSNNGQLGTFDMLFNGPKMQWSEAE